MISTSVADCAARTAVRSRRRMQRFMAGIVALRAGADEIDTGATRAGRSRFLTSFGMTNSKFGMTNSKLGTSNSK